MGEIINLHAREILDSRGNPTVEVECELDSGAVGITSVPSGASTGSYEALELRDSNARFFGKGVVTAVNNVNNKIAKKLIGMDAVQQAKIDKAIIELDGTPNKSNLGANACVGVSLACAVAQSIEFGLPLYKWIGGLHANILPVPMLNIINGGVHADNNIEIQEFMLVPIGENFRESIRRGAEIFYTLKKLLKAEGLSTGVGDEGGFSPILKNNRSACEFIVKAIKEAGYTPGKDAFVAIDAAASNFYKDGKYEIEDKKFTSDDMISFYKEWVNEFPIISIEDGLAEDDWDGWSKLTEEMGKKILIVGDDLYVTNIERLKKGIKFNASNAILIKPNQIGTLTETLQCIEMAKHSGYKCIISHRSGETESTFISHLAVGTNVGLIKSGSLCRSERVAKYNELLRIEEELGDNAKYLGKDAFSVSKT